MSQPKRPQALLFAEFKHTGEDPGAPQGGPEILERHDVIMTGLIKKHGGVLASSAADLFQAVFSSAQPAIACAVAARERFARYNRACDDPSHKVALRQDVHTGSFELGEDGVSGAAPEVLTRLLQATPGGRILTTRRIYHEVRDCGCCAFVFLGPEYFGGLPEPVDVFEVVPVPMTTSAKSSEGSSSR